MGTCCIEFGAVVKGGPDGLVSCAKGMSAVDLGKTVRIGGEWSNTVARYFENCTIVPMASRIGASLAFVGAGAGIASRISDVCRCVSAPGRTRPIDTTKDASLSDKASNAPESSSATRCHSFWHDFAIKFAARVICCCTVEEALDCHKT